MSGYNNLILVGIFGKRRAGKDTFATAIRHANDVLSTDLNVVVRRHAFADALKAEIRQYLAPAFSGGNIFGGEWTNSETHRYLESALSGSDPVAKVLFRPLMQWWGTEFRRTLFGSAYWIEKLDEELFILDADSQGSIQLCLVADVRFPDEASYIREKDGLIVKVTRPDSNPDEHVSETAMDGWDDYDYKVNNDFAESKLGVYATQFYQEFVLPRMAGRC